MTYARRLIVPILTCACAILPTAAQSAKLRPAEIMVLGDSQLAFGSGPAFLSFFNNFAERCSGLGLPDDKLKKVQAMSFGILGVRATGLHMWLSKTKKGTRMICVKDPAGLSNASTYGAMRYRNQRWVQIGESRHHKFCEPSQSPLQNIFSALPEPPKLMIFHFLGLSTFHWLKASRLKNDLIQVNAQMPRTTNCMFLTTIPAYRGKINRPRVRAQDKLQMALLDNNHRCGLVKGVTPKTLAAFQDNPAYYYKNKKGAVKDPYHTTPSGAARFLAIRGPAICRGVVNALWPDGADTRYSQSNDKP
ncbi:MAG: hypothetical protein AAGC70_13025 [Pseudomonadota bacterium]